MDGAETVVESIQVDAATEAANRVADSNAGATLMVASEVAAVGAVLDEHAENSETRHEEILGDTEWIRSHLEQLSTSLQTLQISIVGMQTATLAAMAGLQTTVESAVIQSTATPPSTPILPEIPVVEPVAPDADARPVAETVKEERQRRRRMI